MDITTKEQAMSYIMELIDDYAEEKSRRDVLFGEDTMEANECNFDVLDRKLMQARENIKDYLYDWIKEND